MTSPLSTTVVCFSSAWWKLSFVVSLSVAAMLFVKDLVSADEQYMLIVVGLLSYAAVIIPLLRKMTFEPFDPIVLVAISVFIGCGLRSVLLTFADEGNDKVAALTDGIPLDKLAESSAMVPIALVMLSLGYLASANKRIRIDRLPGVGSNRWNRLNLLIVTTALAVISGISVGFLVRELQINFGSLAGFSAKRALQVESGAGGGYASMGYLRWGADLAKVGLVLLVVDRLSINRGEVSRPPVERFLHLVLMVFLLALSILWPLVSSSRTGVLEVLLALSVIFTYLGFKGGKHGVKRKFVSYAVVSVVLALFILVSMGIWRQYTSDEKRIDIAPKTVLVNNTVGSGNFLPLERTALIIHRMGEANHHFFGTSYLNVVFSPIPRSMWEGKPEMSVARFVRRDLYGRKTFTNGYPAGLLGEAFINFHFAGMIIIPFIAGLGLRLFFNTFSVHMRQKSRGPIVLYSLALWPIGIQLVELDFALVFVNAMVLIVPAVVALAFIGRPRGRRQVAFSRDGAY